MVVWDFWTINPYFHHTLTGFFKSGVYSMIGSDFGMRVNKPAETVEKKTRFRLVSPNLSQKKHVESDMWTKRIPAFLRVAIWQLQVLGHQLSKPWRIHGTVIFTYIYNNNFESIHVGIYTIYTMGFYGNEWILWTPNIFIARPVESPYQHWKVCVLKLKNKVSLIKQNH